jgi:hypothetical protein
MTLKQRQFVKKYLENKGNGTQAAMDVYNAKNYNTAHVIASENLHKPTIQRGIEQALEHAGLSDKYISDMLRKATEAGLGKKADNADSLRGIEMMLKLKGAFPKQIIQSAHLRINLRQDLEKKEYKELKKKLKEMQKISSELLRRT